MSDHDIPRQTLITAIIIASILGVGFWFVATYEVEQETSVQMTQEDLESDETEEVAESTGEIADEEVNVDETPDNPFDVILDPFEL